MLCVNSFGYYGYWDWDGIYIGDLNFSSYGFADGGSGGGVSVHDLVASGGANVVADVDNNSSVAGYVITGAAAESTVTDTTPGHWQYLNNGTWTNLPSDITADKGFLVSATTKVRWSDDDVNHTTLNLLAVDNSYTGSDVVGTRVNTSVGTAYSNTASFGIDSTAANETFTLTPSSRDMVRYTLLTATEGNGGNGRDTINNFKVGRFETDADADRIHLKQLLMGYTADADGQAHYVNGLATIDSGDTITQYLSASQSGGNTSITIDRDGSGATCSPTVLMTLLGVQADLATLLANHQVIVA